DALAPIDRQMPRQYGERVEPHRQIVEILPVAIRRLPDANAARAAEHPVDFRHDPFRLIEKALLTGLDMERNQKHHPKGIGPQVASSLRPYALRAHPAQLVENMVN